MRQHSEPSATAPTVVLVDPTSSDGHSSLALLTDDDAHVLVVVLLSGRASSALHEFAHHEDASVSAAAWIYLDQIAAGLERPGRVVGTIASPGPDTARSLADIAIENDADSVILPSSILRLENDVPHRLARLSPATVTIAERHAVAGVG